MTRLTRAGILLLATHLGEGEVYIDEFLGHRIRSMGGALYRRDEIVTLLAEARLGVEIERHRSPLPHEADTRRIYLLARQSR